MKLKFTRLVIIAILFFAALGLPKLFAEKFIEPQTRVVELTAQKYGYTPGRIFVNKGDTIIIKPTSKDVTHGFYLDGYPVEFIIKQEGIAFQKYEWEDDDGRSFAGIIQSIDPSCWEDSALDIELIDII